MWSFRDRTSINKGNKRRRVKWLNVCCQLASEGKFSPQNHNLIVYGAVIFSYNPIWYKQKNLTLAKLQLKLDLDEYFK